MNALAIFCVLQVLRARQVILSSAELVSKRQLHRVPFRAKMVSAPIVQSERNAMDTLRVLAPILFTVG